jgi:hypothetical protein
VSTYRPSDRRDGPAAAPPAAGDAHAAHDALLIARLAGDDVSGADEARARELVAACGECAALLADLAAISAALPGALPVPDRRRDFRLTPDDAERLRGSRLTRWLNRTRRQPILLLQPLAGATVALGLAMALLSSPAVLPLASSTAGDAAAPSEPVYGEMALPNVTGAPAEGAGGVQKGDGRMPLPAPSEAPGPTAVPPSDVEAPGASPPMLALPSPGDGGNQGPVAAGTPEETPVAGDDGRSQVTTGGEPAASPPPALPGGGPAGAAEPGEPGAVASETQPVVGAAEEPQVPAADEFAGAGTATARESRQSPETWQVWLLVAAAGALVLIVVTLAARRTTSAG